MPIVVQYGGSPGLDPPAPEDEDNIVTALKQSDRVTSIGLTVTSSLLEKLSAIEGPFLELEDLVLLSQDSVEQTLPITIRWGPRLRCLRSTRIAFPALLQLLHPSRNLVDLQLHEFLYPCHFSPEKFVAALSGMAQLRSLSLHFFPTADYVAPPPQSSDSECFVLPLLTRLDFRGSSQYLEGLVAKIEAPRLWDINITFVDEFNFDLSNFSRFIDRIESHKAHRQAHIRLSEHAVSSLLFNRRRRSLLALH
jgi:hypothetical protein